MLAALAFTSCGAPAQAGGIDHLIPFDDSGIWAESVQKTVLYSLIGGEIVGAVWEGGESRVGRVLWQSLDSSAGAALSAEAMKLTFSRVRPRDANDPNLWFQGGSNESFPSGDVTGVASIITPFVLEYRRDHPAIYALELLPVYTSVARMKVHAHWQTDVIAGYALGSSWGMLARGREHPFILGLMPDGVMIGLNKRF